SVYLEAEPALDLARRLEGRCDLGEAARGVLACDRWRAVRFGPLDVHDDPRLRVVQVVTSLQRGGAERLTLALATELGRTGLSCRVVTLGRPAREAFDPPAGVVDLVGLGLDRAARARAIGRVARA